MGAPIVVYPHDALDPERLISFAGARKDAFGSGLIEAVKNRVFFRTGAQISHADIADLRASGAVRDEISMKYSAHFIDFHRKPNLSDEISFEEEQLLGDIQAMILKLRDRKNNMLHLLEAHPSHPTMIRWVAHGWARRLDDVLQMLSEIKKEKN